MVGLFWKIDIIEVGMVRQKKVKLFLCLTN
jgi:hypothetical protein